MNRIRQTLNKYIGSGLLAIFTIIGIWNFSSYGIAWDEPTQRAIGYMSWGYVLRMNDKLPTFYDRDYGVAFEMPLVALEKALLIDNHQAYEAHRMRHLASHLFFLIGAFFCFLLVDYLYRSKWLAALAFLFIVLQPRLYAHSFFNSKDIPFMSMFFICFYLLAKALHERKNIQFILLGVSVALLINLRLAGIIMIVVVFSVLLIDSILYKSKRSIIIANGKSFILFFATSALVLYITWPFLWAHPIDNFAYAFRNMSNFRWGAAILFNEQMIPTPKLPWYYILEWFSISTPIVFVALGATGLVLICIAFIKSNFSIFKNRLEQQTVVYAICFGSPIILVILLHSVVYGDWRHLYFVYAPFVMLVVYALNYFIKTKLKWIALSGVLFTFCSVSLFMIKQAPYQHIYFNSLVDSKTPEYLYSQFELDYWGVSYKESLEYIINNDLDSTISIAVQSYPGVFNQFSLNDKDRGRLKYVSDWREAKYYIAQYIDPKERANPNWQKWFSVKVANNTISSVYKIRPPSITQP